MNSASLPLCQCHHSLGAHFATADKRCGFCYCHGFRLNEPAKPATLMALIRARREVLGSSTTFVRPV
ncbi:MAG: hypothetical protein JO247_05430 [Chloroflexi bacterium]|nr:hypothetical protein [Chloroflexota bacterium]